MKKEERKIIYKCLYDDTLSINIIKEIYHYWVGYKIIFCKNEKDLSEEEVKDINEYNKTYGYISIELEEINAYWVKLEKCKN